MEPLHVTGDFTDAAVGMGFCVRVLTHSTN